MARTQEKTGTGRARRAAGAGKIEGSRVRESEGDEREESEGGDVPGLLFPEVESTEAYVILKRRDDIDKQLVYHGRLSVEEATEERVAAMFGGGSYIAQVRLKNESGKWVFGKQASFRIEGAYRKPSVLPGQEVAGAENPSPSVAVAVQGGDVTDARSVLDTAIVSQLLDMMKATKELASRPPINFADILVALTPIIVAFLNRKPKDTDISPAEIAEQITRAVQQAVQTVTAPQQPVNVVQQLVEAFQAMKGMSETFGGGNSGGDPLLDSIPKLTEILLAGSRQERGPVAPAVTAPVPAAPAVVVPGDVWRQVLAQHGGTLVRFASMRASPSWAAESAVVLMPPDIQEAMTAFLFREDVQEQIMSVVPRLANYPKWLADFVNEARALLAENVEVDPVEDGDGGADDTGE